VLYFLLLFLAFVLALDALVGDRGVIALMRARREHAELDRALGAARAQNAALREEEWRLREDPTAIEELARRNLGLIKPGEMLFIVKDVRDPRTVPR
jgi:cell division protein FtsB